MRTSIAIRANQAGTLMCSGSPNAKTRVVIQRVKSLRTVINHLVTLELEMLGEVFTEFEACVIGGDVNAHALIL